MVPIGVFHLREKGPHPVNYGLVEKDFRSVLQIIIRYIFHRYFFNRLDGQTDIQQSRGKVSSGPSTVVTQVPYSTFPKGGTIPDFLNQEVVGFKYTTLGLDSHRHKRLSRRFLHLFQFTPVFWPRNQTILITVIFCMVSQVRVEEELVYFFTNILVCRFTVGGYSVLSSRILLSTIRLCNQNLNSRRSW